MRENVPIPSRFNRNPMVGHNEKLSSEIFSRPPQHHNSVRRINIGLRCGLWHSENEGRWAPSEAGYHINVLELRPALFCLKVFL